MAAKKRTKRRTMFQETWHRLLKNKGAVIGMAFLALLCVIALVSPLVFNYETDVIGQNLAIKLQPPSGEHWFGTDEYGRDLFARVMYGARYSMAIGIGSVGFGLLVGTILGSIAGFYGGKADDIIMRGIDIFYSIPNIQNAASGSGFTAAGFAYDTQSFAFLQSKAYTVDSMQLTCSGIKIFGQIVNN